VIRLTSGTTHHTIGGVSSTSTGPLGEPECGSLVDHFPGYRYWAPDPAEVVRPAGGPGRLCAYHTTVGAVPIHFHAMAELTLVRAGDGHLRVAGRQYRTAPGLVAFAPPNVLHGLDGEHRLARTVCMFDMGLVEPLLTGDPAAARLNEVGYRLPPAVRLEPDEADVVGRLFDTLVLEREDTSRLGGGVMAASIILQVLVTFLRRATLVGGDDGGDQLGVPDDELTRVLGYVQEHFTRPINRATVARALGMRPEAVSRVFSQSGGETFSAFLQHLRVGHAADLLQGTSLNAADIGRLSGFETYRTFARAFTATFSMSPSAYRDALAAQGADT